MKRLTSILWLLVLLVQIFPSHVLGEDSAAGERVLTPNEERRIQQSNQDLPKDMQTRQGDSRPVAGLREDLRKALTAYQQAVKQFGSGTPQTRLACRHVVDVQKSLHQQFVKEEAIPVLTQLPN